MYVGENAGTIFDVLHILAPDPDRQPTTRSSTSLPISLAVSSKGIHRTIGTPTPHLQHQREYKRVYFLRVFLGRICEEWPHFLFRYLYSIRQPNNAGNRELKNIRSWWHGEGDGRSTFGRFACHTEKRSDCILSCHNTRPTHVVLRSKGLKRGLDDTTSETEDKMEGRLLLDVCK